MSEFPWAVEPSYQGLLSLIEDMNCGVLVRDLEARIVYANKRLLEWSGYSPKELEGQPSSMLTPPELQQAALEEAEAMLAGDLRVRLSVLRRRDGRTYPVVVIPRTLTNADGELAGTFGLVVDLGEVQTAKKVGSTASDLSGSLQRIAFELEALSLATGRGASGPLPLDHPELRELSAREKEVLAALFAGSRVPAIAEQLFISPHTVRNHLKAIFRKVGVSSQSELLEKVRALAGGA